jgi:hypothetical protein
MAISRTIRRRKSRKENQNRSAGPIIEGVYRVKPLIQSFDFRRKGKITLHLRDGRDISVPLQYFPSIRKLNASQRRRYTIANEQVIIFHDADEVFHVMEFLDREPQY